MMNTRILLLPLMLSMSLLLPGCSFLQPKPESILQPQDGLLENWYLKGKVGVKAGKEGGSAYLNWQQTGEDYVINLHGPFGQGALALTGNGSGVTATSQKLGTLAAPTPEELFFQHFGWYVPLSNLYYWIRGVPRTNRPVEQLTRNEETQQISDFIQDGWSVSIPRYTQVADRWMPKKIVIKSPDMKITIAISSWNI